jgi:aspartyl-tRNA synthetase
MYRTHTLGELRLSDVGKEVTLAGWLNSVRDLGAVIFATMRDFYGITQIVISDEDKKQIIRSIPRESTICVKGTVIERTDKNPKLPTGDIEVVPKEIKVLGKCYEQLPFEINNSLDSREDTRLKYRFLDLRNPINKDKLILRSNVIYALRQKMIKRGFMEIQTPVLTSSSPEGARDYLVPSRVHRGKFYALPQAPQQFKQLLMVSGIDRYFQIAPCFRDEDARADRSPGEFYQLDMEMAFAEQDDVFAVMEEVLYEIFTEFSSFEVSKPPFRRISYREAMDKYCSDKPDLRNPLIVYDVSDIFADTAINFLKDKTVKAIPIHDCKEPRSYFDGLNEYVKENKGAGMAFFKIDEANAFVTGIAKLLNDSEKSMLTERLNLRQNSAVLILADEHGKAVKLTGLLRNEAAKRAGLTKQGVYEFCWVNDFPMYEKDEETGEIIFSHNPFSMPQGGLEALLTKNPLDILAYQYDIICNGIELSSGAVRNHSPEIMIKAFEIAGYGRDVVESKFPALFNAFNYGAPPHAGIAPGVDRMVMLLANEPNIREVIAFPMNKNAEDLLMGAPSTVTQKQLDELGIVVKEK